MAGRAGPRFTAIAIVAFCVSCFGCGAIHQLLAFSAKGEFVVRRNDASAIRLVPDDCSPGVQQAFLGYDLYSQRDPSWLIRAVNDPINGPALRLTMGSRAEIFHPDDCSLLQVSARPSGLSVNDVDAYSGFVAANCTNHNSVSIEGRVDIVNCDSFAVDRAQPQK